MERLEQEMRVVRQSFGDDVQDLWKSIHMVCIQKICPKILRDHLAAHASSIDAPEKQRLTIEKFLQASVHGPGASPMDVDAFAKTNGGKQGGKGKDTSCKPGKFDGKCFWCGACVTLWRTVGRGRLENGKRHSHHELPIHQNTKAKEKGIKARRERCRMA